MISLASRRAMASAIWLRTQLPMQTKRTVTFAEVAGVASGMRQDLTSRRPSRFGLRAVAAHFQKMLVDGGVVGQLRVKGGRENAALLYQHGMAGVFGEDLDAAADGLDHGRADKNHLERWIFAQLRWGEVHVARELAAVAVAQDRNVE